MSVKVGFCYTVFNGEELLEKSIKQIEDNVDLIIICFQIISNKGEENKGLKAFLGRFAGKNKVVLVYFTPDLNINTKENERKKHQLMIETAKKNGCSHVVLGACDHFYEQKQFKNAINFSINEGYDVTFTKMFTYYKQADWQITPPEDYYMPFLIKLYKHTEISKNIKYPYLVDPSVKVNTCNRYFLFESEFCVLHHYSMIRDDIKNKFGNAAASIRWTKEQQEEFINEYENYSLIDNPGVKYFQGRKIKKVQNIFNI